MKFQLDEGDFRDLVAGKVIKLRSLQLVLDESVGFERMIGAILEAMEARGQTLANLIRLAAQAGPPTWPKSDD